MLNVGLNTQNFQHEELLDQDIEQMKSIKETIIPADKTQNFYRVPKEKIKISRPMQMCGLCHVMVFPNVNLGRTNMRPYVASQKSSHCFSLSVALLLFSSPCCVPLNARSRGMQFDCTAYNVNPISHEGGIMAP